ncbi:hypothetical protein VNO77_23288 [Canavalia gladiata]|uniref:Uncharacterized protein n=1 Tax=Canavalia gladiata TaxID=3824 RepID=A0AAN9L498_CANGL
MGNGASRGWVSHSSSSSPTPRVHPHPRPRPVLVPARFRILNPIPVLAWVRRNPPCTRPRPGDTLLGKQLWEATFQVELRVQFCL